MDGALLTSRHLSETLNVVVLVDSETVHVAVVGIRDIELALEASIDASEWAHFSDTLVELIAEEVR